MSRFRFVHASDLHLDTPFDGIGRLDPDVAIALRDASLEAWDALIDLTLARQADFIVLAGDIYDGADRGVRAQLRFLRGVEKLVSQGVQVFIAYGNHDPLDGWSAIRRWPDGVIIFGSEAVDIRMVERGGARIAVVHGISYPRRDVPENLALRFVRGTEPGFHVGVLHCNVGSRPEHPAYSPCSLDDLRQAGMDYWALGHIHKREVLNDGHPWVIYPGNLQGRSLKSSERGPKGACVVEVEGETVTAVDFVPLDRVRPLLLQVDIAGVEDIPELSKALLEHRARARDENQDRSLLARVQLFGKGKLHDDLRRPGRLDELLVDLRDAVKGERPFIWWETLINETRPELDLEAIADRGDFSSEVLRGAAAIRSNGGELMRLLDEESRPLQRIGVRRWVGDPAPEDQGAMLERAIETALEVLQEPVEE